MVTNESRNESDITELINNININNKDLSLDINIDILFEKAINTLTNI